MIRIKTNEQIEIMAEGGRILAGIMDHLIKEVKPGISTIELDRLSQELVLKSGGQCSFKGHEGFPACICASINDEIVHGVPSERILKQGDIFSLDAGMLYKGFHTDMAVTIPVGNVSKEAQKLVWATNNCFDVGLMEVKAGGWFGDVGAAIQKYAESQGFNVVRNLCGHGIGKELHEDPQILNYGKKGTGDKIEKGMVFCIEPMLTEGGWRLKKDPNGFGFRTEDGSLSSHIEHTVAVTDEGVRVLTQQN